jgi:hypothetical protein
MLRPVTDAVDLYTRDESGWSSRPMRLPAVPALGHWIEIGKDDLRVTAALHREGGVLEVHAIGDDFAKVSGSSRSPRLSSGDVDGEARGEGLGNGEVRLAQSFQVKRDGFLPGARSSLG